MCLVISTGHVRSLRSACLPRCGITLKLDLLQLGKPMAKLWALAVVVAALAAVAAVQGLCQGPD